MSPEIAYNSSLYIENIAKKKKKKIRGEENPMCWSKIPCSIEKLHHHQTQVSGCLEGQAELNGPKTCSLGYYLPRTSNRCPHSGTQQSLGDGSPVQVDIVALFLALHYAQKAQGWQNKHSQEILKSLKRSGKEG